MAWDHGRLVDLLRIWKIIEGPFPEIADGCSVGQVDLSIDIDIDHPAWPSPRKNRLRGVIEIEPLEVRSLDKETNLTIRPEGMKTKIPGKEGDEKPCPPVGHHIVSRRQYPGIPREKGYPIRRKNPCGIGHVVLPLKPSDFEHGLGSCHIRSPRNSGRGTPESVKPKSRPDISSMWSSQAFSVSCRLIGIEGLGVVLVVSLGKDPIDEATMMAEVDLRLVVKAGFVELIEGEPVNGEVKSCVRVRFRVKGEITFGVVGEETAGVPGRRVPPIGKPLVKVGLCFPVEDVSIGC